MPSNISSEAKAIVDQAMSNRSTIPLLNQPDFPYPDKATTSYGLQAYNNDQFYKLRFACITSRMKEVIPESLARLNPNIAGEVCDGVLDVATDVMIKNKPTVKNPRHLLAPFFVAAKVRDIPMQDAAAEANTAYYVANSYATATQVESVSLDASPGAPQIDHKFTFPTGSVPVKINVPKGMLKDANYSVAAAFSIFTEEPHARGVSLDSTGGSVYTQNSANCANDALSTRRLDCAINGASKYGQETKQGGAIKLKLAQGR